MPLRKDEENLSIVDRGKQLAGNAVKHAPDLIRDTGQMVTRAAKNVPNLVRDTGRTVQKEGVVPIMFDDALNLVGGAGKALGTCALHATAQTHGVLFGQKQKDRILEVADVFANGPRNTNTASPDPVIKQDRLNKQIDQNFAKTKPAGLNASIVVDDPLDRQSVFGNNRTSRPLENVHGKPVQTPGIGNSYRVPGEDGGMVLADGRTFENKGSGTSAEVIPWDVTDTEFRSYTTPADQHRDFLFKSGLMDKQGEIQERANEASGGDAKIKIDIPTSDSFGGRRLDVAEQLSNAEYLKNALDLDRVDTHVLDVFEKDADGDTQKIGQRLAGTNARGELINIGDDDDFAQIPQQKRRYANAMLKRIQGGDYTDTQRSQLLQRLMSELGYESLRR